MLKIYIGLVGIAILGILISLLPHPLPLKDSLNEKNSNRLFSQGQISKVQLKGSVESSQSVQEQRDNLEKYLTVETALLGVSDNISLYFKDLNKQFKVEIVPTKLWVPASIIKAFVILEAYGQKNLRLIDFDQKVIIKRENVVPTELETYNFPVLVEGTRVSIRELVNAMITQSDNTAYNTLIDILDRRNISATLKKLGFINTAVGEKINLDDDQYQIDLQIPGRQQNKTTVEDFARLFNLLYQREIPSSDEILSVFKQQQINYMIPALLPKGTVVAHKTGESPPYYHDGGIIYKPSEPLVLTIFSNHNDPNIISRLAKIAYFKVNNLSNNSVEDTDHKKTLGSRSHVIKYLATSKDQNNILGTKFKKKNTTPSAADLGITTQDLSIDREDARKVKDARITPDNIFYKIKRLGESIQIYLARSNDQRVNEYLRLSANRIAEIKAILKKGDLEDMSYLLDEFNKSLQESLRIIKTTDVPDLEVIYAKQVNDLLFATLEDNRKYLTNQQTSQFTNQLYSFYKENKREITDLIGNQDIENPYNHEPIIGTIKNITVNTLSIVLKDGSQKKVYLFDITPVRGFGKTVLEDISTLKPNSRIAVIGADTKNNHIVPIFILRDIPDNFPQKLEGIVTEINLEENSLKVQTEDGSSHKTVINEGTTVKSRDTIITLDGIKIGSQVVIFGEDEKSTSAFKAITVTVVLNNSGLNERTKITNDFVPNQVKY